MKVHSYKISEGSWVIVCPISGNSFECIRRYDAVAWNLNRNGIFYGKFRRISDAKQAVLRLANSQNIVSDSKM